MKKSILLKVGTLLLSMALVAGVYSFIVIPGVRKEEQEKNRLQLLSYTSSFAEVPVYDGEVPLPKGTVITEALTGLFRTVKIPAAYVDGETVADLRDVFGMQISGTLSKGEYVSYGNLEKAGFERNSGERLSEITVKNNVCGNLRKGSYIDVLVLYGNGEYDVLLAKKRVFEMYGDDLQEMRTLVLSLSEEEYGNVEYAKQKGTFAARVYCEPEDSATAITFEKGKK